MLKLRSRDSCELLEGSSWEVGFVFEDSPLSESESYWAEILRFGLDGCGDKSFALLLGSWR